ncbi:MAG: c-type cytochrome biogenesis protein CcmI [Pseudomonadales bacterium]|jgi:cytochrome c-type biogenesis protein CcmH|nr:c-type cytochrome biogenesis protein CcmI [Pseudomonadales bacterium]
MTAFWPFALLLGAGAAAFVLFPLVRTSMLRGSADGRDASLRRASNLAIYEDRLAEIRADQDSGAIAADEAAALEAELARSLLRDAEPEGDGDAGATAASATEGRGLLYGAALAAPLLAVVLYADWGFSLGALADLSLAEDVQGLAAAERGEETGGGEMRELAVRLAARLEAEPDDLDGWFLLGRTRLQLGEFEAAGAAFGEVAARAPESPVPRVFQAQALYMADDRTLTARVRAIVDAVLTIDPQQPIMLELLAMDAFQNRRFPEAADLFARVLAGGVEDEARRRFLEDSLARARGLAGLPPAPAPGTVAADGPSIAVSVELSPAALAELPPSAAVFVLARPVGGPRMPLAVKRLAPAASLAATLTVEDAMAPAMSLATADQVELVARLSRSGTAVPGPDDLEAVVGPLDAAAGPRVAVRLDPGASSGRLLEAGAGASAPPEPAAAEATGVAIPILVELADGLTPAPDASVFVFAREPGGPPMPLAVARLTAAELPTLVTLDDSMAMMPGRSLSGVGRVELVARITRSGGVVAAPGDFEGSAGPLEPTPGQRVVPLLIDRVVE